MQFADFVIPKTLDEALSILREKGDKAVAVAGCSAFQYLPSYPDRTAVDITRIGLSGITRSNGVYRIGATTTLSEAAAYEDDGWVLGKVAELIPTHPIRNASTVGGNIARVFPWSDLPLVLLALDAVIIIQGESEEQIPATTFFDSQPSRLFKGGRLLTRIELPALDANTGFAYRKESVTYMAFSMMSAAAALTLKGGRIERARLAVGAGIPDPHRRTAAEEALTGTDGEDAALDEAVAKAVAGEPWRGKHGMSDEYAVHLAGVVIRDALVAAREEARRKAP